MIQNSPNLYVCIWILIPVQFCLHPRATPCNVQLYIHLGGPNLKFAVELRVYATSIRHWPWYPSWSMSPGVASDRPNQALWQLNWEHSSSRISRLRIRVGVESDLIPCNSRWCGVFLKLYLCLSTVLPAIPLPHNDSGQVVHSYATYTLCHHAV